MTIEEQLRNMTEDEWEKLKIILPYPLLIDGAMDALSSDSYPDHVAIRLRIVKKYMMELCKVPPLIRPNVEVWLSTSETKIIIDA